ncbi:50S ribosomal protein L12, apicoplast [Plasmodium gonderi]|uniref:50S ribosomal protein L12, apicoplast n=1 Tax=Plasmodium gonderi TaxID=77519 RepID=A0A1Y1JFK5_PLAGO|nr:50S ribosomal protein L12, apicoplast [Plasmodium gonderi]GAW81311.1 50S ribosomal protein L12, apicoplast [Plasmodium gonderi]
MNKKLDKNISKEFDVKRTELLYQRPREINRKIVWILCITYILTYCIQGITCFMLLKKQEKFSYIYLIHNEKSINDNHRRKNYLNYKNRIILKKNGFNKKQKFALKSEKVNKIIQSLKELTLLEASELVKQIEATFSVDTRQNIGVSSSDQENKKNAEDANANEEEDDENKVYDLILENIEPNKKIPIIKIVKEIKKDLNLKQAKEIVDNLPQTLFEKINKETADKWKAKLTEAGATVKLK